jgi:release factor glutamine methyltransferase
MTGGPMAPAEGRTEPEPRSASILLALATARLAEAGSETPRLDAELLVSHAFGRDRTWLHTHPDAALGPDDADRLAASIARRARGEPVAYLRGFKEWFGLRVAVDRRALIPRPETELLAESAIAELAARLAGDADRVVTWDVGTGSGAIALAVALRFRAALALGRVRLVASDVAPDALELAAENLETHGVAPLVTLALGDLLDIASAPGPDVVIANLPYLTSREVAEAPGSIAFEPPAALDGGADGLDVVRRLLHQLPARLARGGVALLEVGAGQAGDVRAEAERLPVPAAVSLHPDLGGVERVVRIKRLDG